MGRVDLEIWLERAAALAVRWWAIAGTKAAAAAKSSGLSDHPHVVSLRKRAEDLRRQRGEVAAFHLRKRLEDLLERHTGAPHHVQVQCALEMAEKFLDIERRHGPLADIPQGAMKKIARRLRRGARESAHENAGLSQGRLLLAAHIQSQTLPGEDAKFVHQGTERILALALKFHERQKAQQTELIDRILKKPSR